ncbi:hypothetical protein F8S20_40640 [Nostoc sp. BAE]|nr:hypothetical protein [Nostoc commune BAE]
MYNLNNRFLGGILCNKHHAKRIKTNLLADDSHNISLHLKQNQISTKTCIIEQQQANFNRTQKEQLLTVL